MTKEKGKTPETLPDEALDDASGGLNFTKIATTSSTSFLGGVRVASGDVNGDAAALKIADGSVKPAADGSV